MRIRAFFSVSILAAAAAFGWDNHTQVTAISLAGEAWISTELRVESLDDFLAAEKGRLTATLAGIEEKAKADYPKYRPLPAALTFDPATEGQALRASFVGAIRINPTYPFALFVQPTLGAAPGGRPELAHGDVDLVGCRVVDGPYQGLSPGEAVSAIEVVESAVDEPDYGMDIGLFEDNGTDYGLRYGFGEQPFGNPELSYGSQAPFHMTFANESGIIRAAAPSYQESYVGYRVDLYSALAREAFASGHAYWGFRFAGWALHYVEDATQPYHSSIIPGKSTLGILALNAFGSDKKIDGEVALVSNRHTIVENYLYSVFASHDGESASPGLFAALRGKSKVVDLGDPASRRWVLDRVARLAHTRGRSLDRAVTKAFPPKYVADPLFDYGAWQDDTHNAYDPLAELRKAGGGKAAAFEAVFAASLGDLGMAARTFMRSLVAPGG